MSMPEFAGWKESFSVSALEPDEIQVWRIPLTAHASAELQLKESLSPAEHIWANRFHFAPDRRRFIIRRAVLRQLLAAILKIEPQAIRLELGAHGKPFVAGQTGAAGLRFSCSHSADWALIALTRGNELGVDLEQRRPMTDAEDLAKNFFSQVEINELAGLPLELKMAGFFNCWTRKEAFIKAIGLGLSYPLNSFSVSLTPNQSVILLEGTDNVEALKRWKLITFDVAQSYSAALAFEKRQIFLKYFTWNRDACS